MTGVTVDMVRELRMRSGAGMMDCKSALVTAHGNMEKAIDTLRAQGRARAGRAIGRVAAEGLVAVAMAREGRAGAVVEINAETDFVARNPDFQAMTATIAGLALEVKGDCKRLRATAWPHGAGSPVEEHVREQAGIIGENLRLRRSAFVAVDNGIVASYVHNALAPAQGQIGVLVGLACEGGDHEALAAWGKKIAMHVAAAEPLAVDREGIPAAVMARERAVIEARDDIAGKPPAVAARMIGGRLNKFCAEAALLEQAFVIDAKQSVAEALEAAGKDVGAPVRVVDFVRFAVGEHAHADTGADADAGADNQDGA